MRHGTGRSPRRVAGTLLTGVTLMIALASCATRPPPRAASSPEEARALIASALPAAVADRDGWTADLYAGFSALSIEPTPEKVCAVAAVIAQESGFRVDPVIPDLPAIAWREIDARAAHVGVPPLMVHGVLKLGSPNGRTYAERIDGAKTEKDLSDIYEDFIATVPLGRTLFADDDPIRTRGPMQVHVAFAAAFAAARPYPYPVKGSIADEVFTRRGGVYFGIAHLLAYPANYDRYRYRFADFNAGQYASRNAAFQRALALVSGVSLVADGALLAPKGEGEPGATEAAARKLEGRLRLSEREVHAALELGKKSDFEQSALYLGVFRSADRLHRSPMSRAVIPQIELHGPKISRQLTTEWYANRVNERFTRCLSAQRPLSPGAAAALH